jgi:hypothetical protein
MEDWHKIKGDPSDNEILNLPGDSFLSFNPMTQEGTVETALVLIKDRRKLYFILNGDFRKEFKECLEKDGIGGVLAFYESHPDQISDFSSDRDLATQLRGAMTVLKNLK